MPFCVLKHEFPGGEWHYDWLLAPSPGGPPEERSLIAFRLTLLPTEAAIFEAQRLPDHRRRYLTYEGPVAGAGGTVRRVVEGECQVLAPGADRLVVRLRGAGVELHGAASESGSNLWRFRRAAFPASGSGAAAKRVDTEQQCAESLESQRPSGAPVR